MKRLIGLIVLAAGCLIAIIVGVVQSQRDSVQVVTVEVGSVHTYVDERAVTSLPEIYELSMPFSGQIEQIDLEAGETVNAGEQLAQVSPSDLANQVAIAQAAVERIEASIAENNDTRLERSLRQQSVRFVESMQYAVDAAAARAEAGEDRMMYAERFLGRIQEMFSQAASSENDLDRAQLEFSESKNAVAQDNLILSAVRAVFAATDLLPTMIDDYIDKKSLAQAVLEKQREEALARLEDARARQQRGVILAPVDGTVLRRHRFARQFVAAGSPLLSIGNLSELQVTADILSQEVVAINVGDQVEVYGGALRREPGQGLAATVLRIAPIGFSKLSSLGVEQQRVRIWIEMSDEARADLLENHVGVDFQLRVRITTAAADKVVRVPRNSVFRDAGGAWNVFVVESGRADLRTVEPGLMNDQWVEVKQGIDAGDVVILSAEESLRDGDRVRMLRD